MTTKKMITAVLLLAAAAALRAQSAEDFGVEQLPDNTLKITGYTGTAKDLVIPGTLYGLKVTVIGERALGFNYQTYTDPKLTGVVIPDTVTVIEEEAFVPEYGEGALTKVSIGRGCKTIGPRAFSKHPKLGEIVIPGSVIEIGDGAFWACGLTKLVLENGVQKIGGDAFSGDSDEYGSRNKLTELVLPPSVKTIGYGAFGDLSLTRITLPANLNVSPAGFETGFVNFYNGQGKKAGTYVKRGPVWTKE